MLERLRCIAAKEEVASNVAKISNGRLGDRFHFLFNGGQSAIKLNFLNDPLVTVDRTLDPILIDFSRRRQ